MLELARRHPDGSGARGAPGARVPRTEEGLRASYAFRDFPHFIDVYAAVSALLTEPEDIADLVRGQVAALDEHPLPAMLGEGLYVTVNSDDPPMFGTTLSNEYLVAGTVLGLPATELAALADNAVRASFLEDSEKDALSGEIAAVLAGHG